MSGAALFAVLVLAPAADWTWKEGPARLVVHDADQVGERLRLPLSRRLVLTLSLEGGETLQVEPMNWLTQTPGWEYEAGPATTSGGRWQQTFRLDPLLSPGNTEIELRPLRYRLAAGEPWREVRWPALRLEVTSRVARTDANLAHGIPGIETEPSPAPRNGLWVWLTAVMAGLVGLALGGWGLWRRRTRPRPAITPAGRALGALDALTPARAEVDPGWHHTRVSAIVRRFLDDQFHLASLHQTTVELFDSLPANTALPPPLQPPLRQLLERCDLARFTGIPPTQDECATVVAEARSFIESTRPEGAERTD